MSQKVKLYNGEPVINVKIIKLGITTYQWATTKHGQMRTGSRQFVEEYMADCGYQFRYVEGLEGRHY